MGVSADVLVRRQGCVTRFSKSSYRAHRNDNGPGTLRLDRRPTEVATMWAFPKRLMVKAHRRRPTYEQVTALSWLSAEARTATSNRELRRSTQRAGPYVFACRHFRCPPMRRM